MTPLSGKVFKSKETMSRDELADLFQTLADKIRTGNVTLSSTDGHKQVGVQFPDSVRMELQVEDSPKRTGIQRELELEMKWRVDETGAPVEQPGSTRGFTIS